MTEKYYTPQIEEFHIGIEFEEEFKNFTHRKMVRPVEDKYEWVKLKLDTSHSMSRIISKIKQDRVRVKYLDRRDLLSLGFEESEIENKFMGGFVFVRKDEVGFNTGVILEITLIQKGNILLQWQTYGSYTNVSGSLQINARNKSNLKRILEDLKF